MNILIIGSGGREHALAWKAAQSNQVKQVWVAPGNAGTALEPKVKNIDIDPQDVDCLVHFAKQHYIDMTIVGPEAALDVGVVDSFNEQNLAVFGPTQKAAMLETSKAYSKAFMQQHHIPTAKFAIFDEIPTAVEYLQDHPMPVVIKADGLAAGKGVVIANTRKQAIDAVESMISTNLFGAAGHQIIIEEFIQGEELSYIALCDGKHILPLASSQDHKQRDEGDQGPNTGGMGAYSPTPLLTPELEQKILAKVMHPTLKGMFDDGIPYTGFLYAGIMVDQHGEPHVLEFNCRLGDPEAQVILMRLQSDLITLCRAALQQNLNKMVIEWDPRPALTVVMASGGYPLGYSKGDAIYGLDNTQEKDTKVFHAGTQLQDEEIVTNGGRVVAITTLGNNLLQAQSRAYSIVGKIHWKNCFYRKDIGNKGLKPMTPR